METNTDASFAARARRLAVRSRRLLSPRYRILQITVLLPTVVSIFYFSIIASDVYVTQSQIVVRSPTHDTSSPLGMLFQESGFTKAQDDIYAVQGYMLSRNALKALDEDSQLRKAFTRSRVDVFSRFPFFFRFWDQSFEALYWYYQGKVEIDIDPDSSILTLTTRAFTPSESFRMNRRLLELGEELVNELNERGRDDLIRFAQREVDETGAKAKASAAALAKYRNEQGIIDPEDQSQIPLQRISTLEQALVQTRSQILQLEKVARNNPQLPVLRLESRHLEREIAATNASVAGAKRSLAAKQADYERLYVDKEVADKLLANSLETLQQARNAALRKHLYVEEVAPPVEPDMAIEPHRARNIAATLILGLVFWGVATLLVTSIREHQD